MCSTGLPKMSLVAQFDDFWRKIKVLSLGGCEKEFKIFVENRLNCDQKWKKVDAENKELHCKTADLESENKRLKTSNKHLKVLLETEIEIKKKIELEKKHLEQILAAVRNVILSDGVVNNQTREKLAILNSGYGQSMNSQAHLQTIEESVESLFSLSDLDQTEDDLKDCRISLNRHTRRSKGKRSSAEETRTSLKKKKLDGAKEYRNKINKEVDLQSNSETNSTSPDIPIVYDSVQLRIDTYDQKYDTESTDTPISQQSSLKHVNKNHQFVTKKNMKNIKCMACRQTIGRFKQSLMCRFCGISYHPECKDSCSMLCFPVNNTPENLLAPKGKFLGPIYSSVTKRRSLTRTPRKTPLTPKDSKSNKPTRFASQLLK